MKISSYKGDENSEENQNTCNSNRYFRSSYINTNSEDNGYSLFSTDSSRSRSSLHKYSYGYHIFSRGIEFFINAKQKHYNTLDRYVFSVLSGLQLVRKDIIHDGIQRLIPEYIDNIPTHVYRYNDAILHMRKDKQKLDEDISCFQGKLKEYNNAHIEFQSAVQSIIENKINAAGYNKSVDNQKVIDIERWINIYLDQIKAAKDKDIHEKVDELSDTIKLQGQRYSENDINTIKEIIHDETVLGYLCQVKQHEEDLDQRLNQIRQKSTSISTAISEGDYDQEADCCPTYLSLLKRLF